MGRRLPPGEAARRARVRSERFWGGETHATYDPRTEGYGSTDEWIAAAEAMAEGRTTLRRGATISPALARLLGALGLDALPDTIANLKRAFRAACFRHHPDHGGTSEAMRNVLAAYEKLTAHYEKGARA